MIPARPARNGAVLKNAELPHDDGLVHPFPEPPATGELDVILERIE